MSITLRFYNTLTRQEEVLKPLDPKRVTMYVCGPTVYDTPHIGNARAVVVYDVLFRLLRYVYGADHVVYARNITDVDDKINDAAKARGIPISALTKEVEEGFHADMEALKCLPPTHQPHATAHIADMITIIQLLIMHGHAYETEGHVYFAVETDPNYGKLAGRTLDAMIAGARVAVAETKRHPGDFVLWKPADAEDDPSAVFESPWGKGRPGWHIECSAMSSHFLGDDFDIHGGGADLMFPHHTNEIAQSTCAKPGSGFARMWIHNGFVTVMGEKMSKSLGNFITVRSLLDQEKDGEVIRMALLSTHYRKPFDWNEKTVMDASKMLASMYEALHLAALTAEDRTDSMLAPAPIVEALADDMNTPLALTHLLALSKSISKAASEADRKAIAKQMLAAGLLMGILQDEDKSFAAAKASPEFAAEIEAALKARQAAKAAKDYATADAIRNALAARGVVIEDKPDGSAGYRLS